MTAPTEIREDSIEHFRQRASKGLAWMKANGSELQLDPRRLTAPALLQMQSPNRCVLAQAYIGPARNGETLFDAAVDRIRTMYQLNFPALDTWLREHGFDLRNDTDEDEEIWERLRYAWAVVISEEGVTS